MIDWLGAASGFDPTAIIISVIGAGGVGGVLIGLLKVRKEGDSIVVTAAQGALVVQSGVLDEVQDELRRSRETNEALERSNARMSAELRDTSAKLIEALNENRVIIAENRQLRERVDELERRVEKLQNGQD